MEQIYYTQCPVGYGLGASNGFQIKRKSDGYPLAGDFRHLSLRPFPGGGRVLAPPVLRYRVDGEIAEVAWLTPRAHEYDTERGLWGRPGGVFAHGLRLDRGEFAAIKRWPAGLFDTPAWKRTDREPSLGRPPDDVSLAIEDLFRPPTFAEVAPLAEEEDVELLARLLTATATATRLGQTLFLIDEAQRLGPRIALLTFAFPEALRTAITFSTYHDRPEELPGFRLQGTTPANRPNKAALSSLGIVADMATGTIEPHFETARWARTLAGWFTRRDAVDEGYWSETESRAAAARLPESPWDDAWLGHLFGFPAAHRSRSAPVDAEAWRALEQFAVWSGEAGLADEWVRPRGAGWWLEAARSGPVTAEGRVALIAHVSLIDSWKGDVSPAAWGEAVALWFREAPGSERDDTLAALLVKVPRQYKPAFARAMLGGLTSEGGRAVLVRLKTSSADRGMLLPLEATTVVSAIVEGADPGSLAPIVEEARSIKGVMSAVLDAVEAGLGLRTDLMATLAESLAIAGAYKHGGATDGREALDWTLRKGESASTWLQPWLRPILADSGRVDDWREIGDQTPESLRPALARAILKIAADPGLPEEAYRWGVEEVLLKMAPRPTDPTWAETYLNKISSDSDLILRLGKSEFRKLGLTVWLKQAMDRGEISQGQVTRISNSVAYLKSLNSNDARSLLSVQIPSVPREGRAALLGQMLTFVGGPTLEGMPLVLGLCREAWPGGFDPGANGLADLAMPIARSMAGLKLAAGPWLDRLTSLIAGLGLSVDHLKGFEPDGLAAEVIASTVRLGEVDPWPLRKLLLGHHDAWRALAADIRRELGESKVEATPEILGRWDKHQDKPSRFFETFLNACDGPRLALAVLARSADLTSLSLAWWKHGDFDESTNDLRDAFARLAPIAPMPSGKLYQVRKWINEAPGPGLSSAGQSRWRCLEALTDFHQAGSRWPVVWAWEKDLPLVEIPKDDRYRFLAWMINDLDAAEDHELSRLAKWLRSSGVDDASRVGRWAELLGDLVENHGMTQVSRAEMVHNLKTELMTQANEARSPKSMKGPLRNREQS